MLTAQTVTTTTVTTKVTTTYPSLRLPRIDRHKLLRPDIYPLAHITAPPALEQFALDLNGQHLFFSQRDLAACHSDDVLASIEDNMRDDSHEGADEAFGAGSAAQPPPRAMTPMYTQDDATKDAERQMRLQMLHAGGAAPDAAAAAAAAAAAGRRPGGGGGGACDSREHVALRRSSSPPASGERNRTYGRGTCSPSPRRQAAAPAGVAPQELQRQADIAAQRQRPASGGSMRSDGGGGGDALDDRARPLPSPLLSPRAQPEPMDTDDVLDEAAYACRRRLRFPAAGLSPPASARQSGAFDAHEGILDYVAHHGARRAAAHTVSDTATVDALGALAQRRTVTQATRTTRGARDAAKDLAALYSLPSIMATYDNLPPTMQTYLLFQLLRRTPRPTLQFAAQTVLPVLHRDFVGGLPAEAAHHVLRFMDTRTLCRAACVSRKWLRAVDGDRTLWRARLLDARYAAEAPRVHPLCHAHFGLGAAQPPRSPTCSAPTPAELSLAPLAARAHSAAATAAALAAAASTPHAAAAAGNAFKAQYARDYRLDRNWQAGACRHFSFACDGGAVVTCVQLTDRYIVAGFDTKNIFVFDIDTGATVRQLVGHEGGVWALAVVGGTVVSGSTDRTVRVWDLESGRCTHVFAGHSSTVRCLQVLLPTDVRTARERALGAPVRYEPPEPLVVTGSRDTTLRVWKLPSPLNDAPYSPRSAVAAGHAAALARTAGRLLAAALRAARAAEAVRVAESIAMPSIGDAAMRFRSPFGVPRANPYFVRTLGGHTDSVRAVAGHGNMVVSGSYDFSIRVWNLATGAQLHQLEGHTSKVYTIVLDTERHLILSGSMDGTIRVWNWDSGACLRILRGHLTLVGLLALQHDTLVSAGADTTLRIWDHPTVARPQPKSFQRPFSNIRGDHIPVTPAGSGSTASGNANANTNATGHLVTQTVASLQQAQLLQQLQLQQRANDQLHHQQLLDISSTLAAGDMVRNERSVLRQHTSAITCFQHDGTKIVSGADTTLKLWDVRTGAFVRDLLANLTSVWQVRFDKR
ncbi:SCF ubiquitin ligase complex subunit cdc4, partial [Kickxella alabastrina]